MDDGSTDAKLVEYMDNYAKDARVTVIRNEMNKGIAFALNTGMQAAREISGVQYIARMDSDDICFKERIKQQVCYMELNPNIDICGTNMIILRQNSEPRVITMPCLDQLIRF